MVTGISVLCPTRNRPDGVRRLIRSATDTAEGEIEFILYVDRDALLPEDITDQENVLALVGDRIVLSQMWNECFKHAKYDIVMQGADDLYFRSQGWDTAVTKAFEEFPDRIVLVSANYCDWGADLTTHGFLHRRWIETVGYFCPPYFASDMNDKWISELSKMIGRHVYLEHIVIEHMHPIWAKASYDSTHLERLQRHSEQNPQAVYDSLEEQRKTDATKLLAAIKAAS